MTTTKQQMGDRTITDLYLPGAASDRVPLVGGSALVIGAARHALAFRKRQGPQAG